MKKVTYILLGMILFLNLSNFAQHPDFYYSSPVNGSDFINPEQVILLKSHQEINEIDYSKIVLEGTESGQMVFTISIEKGNLLFIKPVKHFTRGEQVTLTIEPGAIAGLQSEFGLNKISFAVKAYDNLPLLNQFYRQQLNCEIEKSSNSQSSDGSPKYVLSENEHNYPDRYPVTTLINRNNPDPRPLLTNMITFFNPKFDPYIMILDTYGTPLYFKRTDGTDIRVLQDGNLCYAEWNFFNASVNYYLTVDDQYKAIDTIRMGNGYFVDAHDILLLENGHYLLMAYDPKVVDMSGIVEGGNPEAVVIGLVIQEVDIDRNVYFEWRSWDHMEITEASDAVDLTGENIDYVHANAFEFDHDGNLLVSQRHMDEITKINYQTGDIIWRMGVLAKMNDFTFNDTIGFSHQHDIRVLPNGNFTIYDNGNSHKPFPFTQVVEYEIDEDNKTATKVWGYKQDTNMFAFATGSSRRITEDRTVIGWGFNWPLLASEVSLDGEKHFDLLGSDSIVNYRALKQDWDHNVFTFSKDTLDFGVYDDYVPVNRAFSITNQMAQDTIRITSSHNHQNHFWLTTQLPLVIPPGEDESVIVSFQPQQSGVFNDVLTLNYDNNDTTERIARQIHLTGKTPIGIVEYENEKVSVHPNPVTDVLNISIDLPGEKNVSIVNLQGQEVMTLTTAENNIRLSTSQLAKGVYMGLVRTGDKAASFRFVKN